MSDLPTIRRQSSPHVEALLRDAERGLRRQNSVLVELARRPSIHSGNLAEALGDIARAAAETLEVERVGVWFFTHDRQAIRCVELFERTPAVHSGGGELTAARYPVYFNALEGERAIAAHDARLDPRTSAFTNTYLTPFGVTSMLDAPIRRLGHIAGVVCFEHTGPQRNWTIEEENFATSIADLVAMAIDATDRRQAQEALRHRVEFEKLVSSISSRFVNLLEAELCDAIQEALAEIGAFIGADSCHIFLMSDDRLSARMVYEWDAPGIPRRQQQYGDLPAAAFPWWIERVEKNLDNICLNTLDDLPPEAVNERRLMERQGIYSLLFVPMVVKKTMIGSVGASTFTKYIHWTDEIISLLRIAGEMFASAIERSRTMQALRASEERYRLMADNSTDLISRTTARGVFVYASDAVRVLLGYEPGELIGRSVFEVVVPEDRHIVRRFSVELQDPGAARTFSYRAQRKDGSFVWFETTSRGIVNAETGQVEIVSVSRDISERRHAEEQIEYQAYHDALTGLPNRLLFRDRLTMALAHAKRQQAQLAVMFLDLDRFKYVNDTLGHSLGDELLRAVAARLRSVLRDGDTIARMGGDEFTVLLTDASNAEDAAKVAQKLLDTVAHPLRVEGHELYVTTSIGIALFPDDGDSAEALLKSADSAMYRAKEIGRNSYQLCTRAMNSRAAERLSVENALRRAVERDELVLHYQPLVRLEDRGVAGYEALLRWNRAGYGLVPPATFIGIAEETRMIVPIGEWVLRNACLQAKRWQSERNPHLRMAVNLSPRQFQQSDLCDVVAAALSESGLEPRYLELEITEGTAMLNTDRTMATLAALRELGVRIAIDDFGTGHSALSYLRRFPIDRVKIDREFIQEIGTSRSNRAIVSAIAAMAHGLDLVVTAEGVETEEQVAFLVEQRCEEVQGFLFGRPV
ncbi:MAG: EAL domain-containing protein [Acidobacteriota bacterium]|nr:EAL domain-containing protein [Acidobacteriota bacterium]